MTQSALQDVATSTSGEGTELEPGHFWLPGPTEVHPDVLRAQFAPVISHRGPAAVALMDRLQPTLKQLFGTERNVMVLTASATALMEAGVRNGVRRGLLSLVNGAFSERFAVIARDCDVAVDTLEVPWGQVIDPDDVRERLRRGDFDAVSVVHSETSTGALNPIGEIADAVREFPGVRLLVDSVTGVGGAPMRADDWGLDLALTGSQKALAMPPGMAFGVASEALLERAVALGGRGYYLDFERLYRHLEKGQVPTTPAITLMYAAAAQLARISEEGLEARFERHEAMAERCRSWVGEVVERHGIELCVQAVEGHRSPTVTCVALPVGVFGPDVVAAVRRRGWVIGSGYGKLKSSTIRIGHMGDHTLEGLERLLPAVEDALREVAGRG